MGDPGRSQVLLQAREKGKDFPAVQRSGTKMP